MEHPWCCARTTTTYGKKWCLTKNATTTRQKWCRSCTTYTISSMAANYPAICPPSLAVVEKGFWRQDKKTRKILRCPWGSACLGGADPTNQCLQGHTGALCQVCKKDWTLLSGTCYPCENVDTTMRKWVAIVVLAAILVGLAYYAKLKSDENKTGSQAGAGGASGADEAVGVVSQATGGSSGTVQSRVMQWAKILDPWFQLGKRKFKIVISFYQVVTSIPRFYPFDFPITLQDFVAYFNIVNLEFTEIVPVDCFGTVPYEFRYLLKAIAPLVMSAFFYVLGTAIADKLKRQILFKLYLFFLFTIYPAMCSMGGETLRCLETSDADVKDADRRLWLKSDYSIDCRSLGSFLIVDVFCMILYPIGIPALFYFLMKEHETLLLDGTLRPDRNHLDEGPIQQSRGMAPVDLTHLEALCVQYKPEYWWFEVFECVRKYLLVSVCIAVFNSHPSSAMLSAVIISVASILLFSKLEPYEFEEDDILAYIAHCTLALIFLLASYTRFINKLNEATASSDAERGSDWSKKEVWAWQALVVISCFLVLFVFVFAFGSAIYEIYWGNEVYHKNDPTSGGYQSVAGETIGGDTAKFCPEALQEIERMKRELADKDRVISDAKTTIADKDRSLKEERKANRENQRVMADAGIGDKFVSSSGSSKIAAEGEQKDGAKQWA